MIKNVKIDFLSYVPYFYILKKSGLNENDLLVFGFIVMFYKIYSESYFYFTDEQISKILNLEIQKIQESISILWQKKLIKRVKLFEDDQKLRKILVDNENFQKILEQIKNPISQEGGSLLSENAKMKIRKRIDEFKNKIKKRY